MQKVPVTENTTGGNIEISKIIEGPDVQPAEGEKFNLLFRNFIRALPKHVISDFLIK